MRKGDDGGWNQTIGSGTGCVKDLLVLTLCLLAVASGIYHSLT